uniref:HK97 gp10 family phage protein n=1 Tax=Mangrovicoccus ximenensis TaxID=1911570 RepID=UPI00191C6A78
MAKKFDLAAQSAKLAKRLEAIPAEIIAELRPAIVKGAEDLRDVAAALAPEDEGDLKESIVITEPGEMTPAYAEGGGKRLAAENQALVTVGNPEQRHGHLVEFGTEPHDNGGQFAGSK